MKLVKIRKNYLILILVIIEIYRLCIRQGQGLEVLISMRLKQGRIQRTLIIKKLNSIIIHLI
jgi:hypothetical protein